MRSFKCRLIFLFQLFILGIFHQANAGTKVELPGIILEGISSEIIILADDTAQQIYGSINGQTFYAEVNEGKAIIPYTFEEAGKLEIRIDSYVYEKEVKPIPLWWSIIPPFIAIFMALIFREVISSLFIGIFSGGLIIHLYTEGAEGIITGLMAVIDTYVMGALYNKDHLAVITFSTLIGGMVAVISKNGGMQGVVDKLSVYAKSPKSGQFITWLLGVLIFFDDYANTLIVGNTMRPLTDKHGISREKLSYLVDSTAAPIAAIAFVTTWIGAELGYINDGIKNLAGLDESPYIIFLHSLQYSFYPILTLFFMLILIWKSKDYGPMLKAERMARHGLSTQSGSHIKNTEIEEFMPEEGIRSKWFNAAIPVAVVIIGTIIGLFHTGWDDAVWNDSGLTFIKKLSTTIGNANAYLSLLWSSMSALIVAILLSISQKIVSLGKALEVTMAGFKTMLTAVVILVLAWALASVTEDMHTADFITGLLSDNISPAWIPALTFILSALVAFSTGSSWGTMAILYPLMLPACWKLSMDAGMDSIDAHHIFYNVVSSVLAGSVLGDHCSPISDTTILSSLASSCNHIDHVRTQLPYALTVGLVALVACTIPSSFGFPSYLSMLLGLVILYLVVHFIGKDSSSSPQAEENKN